MRRSIGFPPPYPACQLSGWPFAAEGPAPGQRRALVVSGISRLAQQLRQLGEVGGDAPGFVAGEQLRRRASGLGTALEIDVGERLTVGVHDHEACRVIASQKPLRIKCYAAP